ncbi:hypothetical protein [Roseivirga seohaensis]
MNRTERVSEWNAATEATLGEAKSMTARSARSDPQASKTISSDSPQ